MSTKRPSSERATERVMRTPSTLALAIVAGLLAIAVGWPAAERGFGPPLRTTEAATAEDRHRRAAVAAKDRDGCAIDDHSVQRRGDQS